MYIERISYLRHKAVKSFYSVKQGVYPEHILPVSQGSKVFLQCKGRYVSRAYPTCITRGSVDLTVCILEGLWASPLNISCVLVFTQKISLWSTHPSLKPDPCLCWDHLIRIMLPSGLIALLFTEHCWRPCASNQRLWTGARVVSWRGLYTEHTVWPVAIINMIA